ncbi:hypothetical protein HPB48_000189 [Haemaphysalis longicornis]|uniref:Uncharacterized protein n=1 Tax=Haemaphysalis longicornis TaxID=44386 RepID=A0A9J6G819_HAELO|nr:hypothetical protein HPB48_000189 [Haemaphysalis longicornis]
MNRTAAGAVNDNSLVIWQWNRRGYDGKKVIVQVLADKSNRKPDVIVLQETVRENAGLPGYKALASPTSEAPNGTGGTCTFITTGICQEEKEGLKTSTAQHTVTELVIGKKRKQSVCVVNIYRRPSYPRQRFNTLMRKIGKTAGSAVRVIVEVSASMTIMVCAIAAFVYTSLGGLYSVATTDTFQVLIMTVGLWSCVPFCLKNNATGLITGPDADWVGSISDVHLARVLDEFATTAFGGIAWQLVDRETTQAYARPVMAVTLLYPTTDFTTAGYPGPFRLSPENQHEVLPYSLRYLTNHLVSVLGLAAISGAVMSSVDSSALSIASLLTRNLYLSMLRPTRAPAGRNTLLTLLLRAREVTSSREEVRREGSRRTDPTSAIGEVTDRVGHCLRRVQACTPRVRATLQPRRHHITPGLLRAIRASRASRHPRDNESPAVCENSTPPPVQRVSCAAGGLPRSADGAPSSTLAEAPVRGAPSAGITGHLGGSTTNAASSPGPGIRGGHCWTRKQRKPPAVRQASAPSSRGEPLREVTAWEQPAARALCSTGPACFSGGACGPWAAGRNQVNGRTVTNYVVIVANYVVAVRCNADVGAFAHVRDWAFLDLLKEVCQAAKRTAGSDEMAAVVRVTVFLVVLVSTVVALSVRSVYSLWSLSSDLAYVLLFPQLMCLFFVTEHTNAYGVLADGNAGQSLSVTLLASFIFKELFVRGAIRDFWRCFVVVGQDNTGRLLVKSGMKPIYGPLIEPAPEGPALADGREAGRGADVHTPLCLPEAVTVEYKVLKPDSPELSATLMTRSSIEEYWNDIHPPKPSKSPSARPSKIDGNDKIDAGASKKASKTSTPVRTKAPLRSPGKKSARPSRITSTMSKSLKKRLAKSGHASVQ